MSDSAPNQHATDPVHRCVGVILCDEGRVLLGKRSSQKPWFPNVWDVIGGHVEAGETELDALVREADEELGVVLDLRKTSVLETIYSDDLELTIYASSGWSGQVSNNAPAEHDEVRWFEPDDVESLELAVAKISELAQSLDSESFKR